MNKSYKRLLLTNKQTHKQKQLENLSKEFGEAERLDLSTYGIYYDSYAIWQTLTESVVYVLCYTLKGVEKLHSCKLIYNFTMEPHCKENSEEMNHL